MSDFEAKDAVIRQALASPEGKVVLAQAMVEPISVHLNYRSKLRRVLSLNEVAYPASFSHQHEFKCEPLIRDGFVDVDRIQLDCCEHFIALEDAIFADLFHISDLPPLPLPEPIGEIAANNHHNIMDDIICGRDFFSELVRIEGYTPPEPAWTIDDGHWGGLRVRVEEGMLPWDACLLGGSCGDMYSTGPNIIPISTSAVPNSFGFNCFYEFSYEWSRPEAIRRLYIPRRFVDISEEN